jgi:hypothetical protein
MKNFLLAVLLAASCSTFAQNSIGLATDTVMQGYYLPLDSNVISCKVSVIYDNISSDTVLQGNKLPAMLTRKICSMQKGTVVVYHELTIMKNSVMVQAPPVRYLIGSKNTKPVLRDPTLPILISANDLADYKIDPSYVSFTVSFLSGEKYVDYEMKSNKLTEEVKAAIRALPPGTKVFFERVNAKNKDGVVVKQAGMQFKIQ